MKIYDFDGEYVAAETEEQAIAFLADLRVEEYEDCDYCDEMSDDQIDKYKYFGQDKDGNKTECSFRVALQRMIDAGMEFPCYFAADESFL